MNNWKSSKWENGRLKKLQLLPISLKKNLTSHKALNDLFPYYVFTLISLFFHLFMKLLPHWPPFYFCLDSLHLLLLVSPDLARLVPTSPLRQHSLGQPSHILTLNLISFFSYHSSLFEIVNLFVHYLSSPNKM